MSLSVALEALKVTLKSNQFICDPNELETYGKDWCSHFTPNPVAVVFPHNSQDVQNIIHWARQHKIALVPSGGRTGLSGGAIANKGEVVVSMVHMNRILSFNDVDYTLTCQSGTIIEQIQKYALAQGLYYPVDFAARGSAHIGGTVNTNAGGIRVIRYGMTRNWITGLKVVTGTGELLNLNNGLIKNATGYDFRHLIIGSEGTLGIVTEVTVQLTAPPRDTRTLFIALPKFENVTEVFRLFREQTQLLAFEFLSHKALEHVCKTQNRKSPFAQKSNYYLVIEIELTHPEEEQKLFSCLEENLEQGLITDGVLAQSSEQTREFWALRENVSESCAPWSPYKNDISVTAEKVPLLITELEALLKKNYPFYTVLLYGHIGDGNIHINILKPENIDDADFVEICHHVDHLIFDLVKKCEGSISAEHGIGLIKKTYLYLSRSNEEIRMMKEIKNIFDPDCILNPGKLFDL